MAIYTKLTASQIEKVIKLYGLDRPKGIRGILEGTVNTYYELSYPKRSYYLKIDEVGDKRRLVGELKILKLLGSKFTNIGLSFPQPLRTIKGRQFIPLKGKFVLIFEKLNGHSIPLRGLKTKHLTQIGKKMAMIHLRTRHLRGISPHRFTQSETGKVYSQIRHELERRHPTVGLEVRQWLGWLKKEYPQGLPSGLIHADLFPENILFERDKLTGIVDFEAAGYGPFLFDIAVCLHACCHAGLSFDRRRVRHFISGYQSQRTLIRIERGHLEYFLYESALRFLLTRLRDFELKGGLIKARPFKDYREYLMRFSEIPELVRWVKLFLNA